MSVATTPRGYIERPRPSGLADVIEVILDKGMVIDAFVRVSLIGIEILTIDARIVIASVDTYLRFAEAVNRLDIVQDTQSEGLPQLIEDMTSGGAKSKTKGAIEGVKETVKGDGDGGGGGRRALDAVKQRLSGDDDENDENQERPKKRARSSSSRKSTSSRSSRSRSNSRSKKSS
jgi:gas vesicle structural protein